MSKRNQKNAPSEDAIKMTKEQEEIAKYIRFNCPTATTMFEGNEVHYFSGNKAVDTLWDSKYGNKAKNSPMFKTRDDCFHYICELNSKQLFFRAKKLVAKKKENKDKGNDSSAEVTKSPKGTVEKRNKKGKEEETATEAEGDEKEETKKDDKKDEEKKKKKVKLLVHDIQTFVDDKDVYVWVFDPTPLMKKIIGVLMLVGTIVGCLFPLWPAWLRQGVYYVSITGIGCFAAIIVTAILRTILFGIIYAVTFGKHKLWILPNLTEDCGVLESFQPWYTYECCGDDRKENKKDKKEKKSKKAKDSDAEEEVDEPSADPEQKECEDEEDAEKYSQASTDENYEKIDDEEISAPPSPSEGIARKRRPAKV
ncbi:hypothetical protein GCK72_005636 [Caenorhabditis remanei]|uniref:Translocation protein SEC62 n=1 Tax=Caenorhabditis remanei TaxID=31234 RepID=A0A2P4WBR3_CAERE|nr:hypothetical protein GCK72_005636 [Caenorhabditis remanei]KAF1765683.1 hypothetical protein GCK72_005636 [Caenorhabditis remanei]